MTMITQLIDGDVFVFESSLNGFHGAGSAGYAMRGTPKNTWRNDKAFRDITSGKNPDKRGKCAVFGVGEGFQSGTEGCSYAIPTVEKPGVQGKVDLRHFAKSVIKFVKFAKHHPELTFMVVSMGATRAEGGLSYLGKSNVESIWDHVAARVGLPTNIILPYGITWMKAHNAEITRNLNGIKIVDDAGLIDTTDFIDMSVPSLPGIEKMLRKYKGCSIIVDTKNAMAFQSGTPKIAFVNNEFMRNEYVRRSH